MEILAAKAPDPHGDKGLENPHQVAPGEPNWGWAGTPLKAVLEGPLQGAAGAVGDRAPQGPGAGAKIGWHHQLARLPPSCPWRAGAPTPGPVAREPPESSKVVGGALELGVGGMTPTWLSSW